MNAGVAQVAELEAGMDFRLPQYRREVFHRFYQFHLEHRAHPGCVYYLLPYLDNEFAWSAEDALWFAFLNGCTQHPPTSLLIHERFPYHNTYGLAEWFNTNFRRLGWDSDRRHWKSKFLECVRRYQHLVGPEQADFFEPLRGDYEAAWAKVRNEFYSFGRLSAFSYLEYLSIFGYGWEPNDLLLDDIAGSRSHRNGLAKVLGRDDLDWHESNPAFDGKYAPGVLDWMAEEVQGLLVEARLRSANKPWLRDTNLFTLESTLCTFKSWFRPNRRYPNCYNDMLRDRLVRTAADWSDEATEVFWKAREDMLPGFLRIEDNPDDVGLRPLKQNWFRQTGEVIMIPDPAFKNGYNDWYTR